MLDGIGNRGVSDNDPLLDTHSLRDELFNSHELGFGFDFGPNDDFQGFDIDKFPIMSI